jgi:cell division protein FtsB
MARNLNYGQKMAFLTLRKVRSNLHLPVFKALFIFPIIKYRVFAGVYLALTMLMIEISQ